MKTTTCIAIILAAAWPAALRAQVQLRPGMRVRVTAPRILEGRRTGTLSGMRGDTLLLSLEGTTGVFALAPDQAERLEVSVGQHGHAGLGFGIGAATGALVGLLGSIGVEDEQYGCGIFQPCTASEKRQWSVLIGALFFGGVGALFGLEARSDDWRAVPPSGVRVGVLHGSGGRGPGFGISIPLDSRRAGGS